MSDIRDFLASAAHVVPSARQLDWFEQNFYAFVHFGVNTFTDREWGLGTEDPKIFNPVGLDCDQWVRAAKSAGMRGMVLTAKHHDGFCLWPSRHTEHSVKNSPFRDGYGDVVRELSDACRRAGLKFGFYLSPWDRNSKLYGTEQYNNYYKAQLTELLTHYGDIFMVWFDGACGEGPNGKKQNYDFRGYIDLVRRYQPNACVFNDAGPDVRYVGNESGKPRFAEWAVVPRELTHLADVQTGPGPLFEEGALSHTFNTHPEIGALSNILPSGGLCFCPAETDMSIRPGWFWHGKEEPHSLDRLAKTYITSVGGNSGLNLNIPPDRDGLFDLRDVKRLGELGAWLNTEFGSPLAFEQAASGSGRRRVFDLALPGVKDVKYVELRENLNHGQRIETYLIDARRPDGTWRNVWAGTTVGNRRIARVDARTDALRVRVTFARGDVHMRSIKLFEGVF